jgi:hypothetical protein
VALEGQVRQERLEVVVLVGPVRFQMVICIAHLEARDLFFMLSILTNLAGGGGGTSGPYAPGSGKKLSKYILFTDQWAMSCKNSLMNSLFEQ